MKKKILKTLAVFLGIFIFIIACRSSEEIDTQANTENQKIEAFVRFENKLKLQANKSTSKKDDADDNYAYPFAEIISYFMDEHPEFEKQFKDEYGTINLNVASQTIGETDKYVFFPVLRKKELVGALGCKITEDLTFASFRFFSADDAQNQELLSAFENHFDQNSETSKNTDLYARSISNIEEVIITVYLCYDPEDIDFDLWHYQDNAGTAGYMDGGSNIYSYAYGGGSGTGGSDSSNSSDTSDPCNNLKTQNTNTQYKSKVDALSKNSVLSLKHETGYSENKIGNFSALPLSSSTSNSDALRLSFGSNTKGFIHTHINDYEDGTFDANGNPRIRKPIRMFSPADVNAFMEIVQASSSSDYSDLYATMISSEGNYTLKFTGTASDIKTGLNTEEMRDLYQDFMANESGTIEAKFLRFLSEVMGISGIDLFKIKDNGTIKQKSLNSNNKVESTKCPD